MWNVNSFLPALNWKHLQGLVVQKDSRQQVVKSPQCWNPYKVKTTSVWWYLLSTEAVFIYFGILWSWLVSPGDPMWNLRNTGALLARWCNDHVKATPHRVVATHRERYSIAFFCDPDKDTPIPPRTSGGFDPCIKPQPRPMISDWGIFAQISVRFFLDWDECFCISDVAR